MNRATVTHESALLSSSWLSAKSWLHAREHESPQDITSGSASFRGELRRNGTTCLEISATGPVPIWLDKTLRRLQEILDLDDDWDSYGAQRVNIESAHAALEVLCDVAREFVPAPSIVPTVDGGVQIEWHRDGIDLEIEVVSRLNAVAYLADLQTGEEWECALDSKIPEIRQRLCRMND